MTLVTRLRLSLRSVREAAVKVMQGRSGSESVPSNSYYPQQPSCQIPNIGLIFERFLGRRTTGVYVEVGAYDGVFVSNTWGLAQRGWVGHLIEPVPEFAAACRQNYSAIPRVRVHQIAIAQPNRARTQLRIADTLTTANEEQVKEYFQVGWASGSVSEATVEAKSCSLDEFLASVEVAMNFDVLVVDVEGFEAAVFSGFELERWLPKLIVVELADLHPDLSTTAQSDALLGKRIQDSGYVIVYKDAINTVFVRRETWSSAFGLKAESH